MGKSMYVSLHHVPNVANLLTERICIITCNNVVTQNSLPKYVAYTMLPLSRTMGFWKFRRKIVYLHVFVSIITSIIV